MFVPVAIGGPDQLPAVRAEHGEPVEIGRGGDLFQPGAVDVYRVEIELAASRGLVVGREDDPLAVRVPVGREVGAPQMGDLMRVAPVGVGHPELQVAGPHQPLLQKLEVVGGIRGRLGILGAPEDFGTVGAEERTAVIAHSVGDPADIAPVGVHGIQLDVAVLGAGKDQPLAVGRGRGFRVVGPVMGERLEATPVGVGGIDLEMAQGPDVALGIVGVRRTGRRVGVGGAVEDPAAAVEKVPAGGPALAVGDAVQVGAVAIDDVFLVAAGVDGFLALEDQLLAVGREIRLRVVAAGGELADVRKMPFAHRDQRAVGGGAGRRSFGGWRLPGGLLGPGCGGAGRQGGREEHW